MINTGQTGHRIRRSCHFLLCLSVQPATPRVEDAPVFLQSYLRLILALSRHVFSVFWDLEIGNDSFPTQPFFCSHQPYLGAVQEWTCLSEWGWQNQLKVFALFFTCGKWGQVWSWRFWGRLLTDDFHLSHNPCNRSYFLVDYYGSESSNMFDTS